LQLIKKRVALVSTKVKVGISTSSNSIEQVQKIKMISKKTKNKEIKYFSVPDYPVSPGRKAKKLFFDLSGVADDKTGKVGELIYKTAVKELDLSKKDEKED